MSFKLENPSGLPLLSDDAFQEGGVGVKVRLCQLMDVILGLHLSEPFPHQ